VSDIGDAMLLARLLQALLDRGVVLVATSNSPPDNLYRHGLQRSRFLPAIALIKARLDVTHIDSGVDYRLRALEKVEIYHWPLDQAAESNLESAYFRLAKEAGEGPAVLDIAGRRIMANHVAPGVAWFDFREICGGPRGQADYIELARLFHTVLIANVPRMGRELAAEARRFTWLVDEFYDRRVKLILSAEAPPDQLCQEGDCAGEFARTVSRLAEMQTHRYLAEPHVP
jgi:cell division protein ZapE